MDDGIGRAVLGFEKRGFRMFVGGKVLLLFERVVLAEYLEEGYIRMWNGGI